MVNQGIWLALLPIMGVILGAALQHYFSRNLESRKQLALKKSEAYVDYFRAVALLAQHAGDKATLAMAADAKVRICMYGSPLVIKRLGDFERAGARTDSTQSEFILMALLKEMRKDTGASDSMIEQEELHRVLFRQTT